MIRAGVWSIEDSAAADPPSVRVQGGHYALFLIFILLK